MRSILRRRRLAAPLARAAVLATVGLTAACGAERTSPLQSSRRSQTPTARPPPLPPPPAEAPPPPQLPGPPMTPPPPTVGPDGEIECPPVPAAAPTDACAASRAPTFRAGPFEAQYFDKSLLVAEEVVERISINYAWSEFHGIPSERFRATYRGDLTVTARTRLAIQIDQSWANVDVLIDGEAIISGVGGDVDSGFRTFEPGTYRVEVRFSNNWHTVGFKLAFTDAPVLDGGAARFCLADALAAADELLVASAYQSSDRYNEIAVTLAPRAGPVFLFLSAYSGVHWRIDNPHGVAITGIAYNAVSSSTTIDADPAVPRFHVASLPYASKTWEQERQTASCRNRDACDPYGTIEWLGCFIEAWAGRGASVTQFEYGLDRVTL